MYDFSNNTTQLIPIDEKKLTGSGVGVLISRTGFGAISAGILVTVSVSSSLGCSFEGFRIGHLPMSACSKDTG